MQPASFTIEFAEHLEREKVLDCIAHLGDAGASVERQGERVFCLVCSKPRELNHVGWALFHTFRQALPRHCNVWRRRESSKHISKAIKT